MSRKDARTIDAMVDKAIVALLKMDFKRVSHIAQKYESTFGRKYNNSIFDLFGMALYPIPDDLSPLAFVLSVPQMDSSKKLIDLMVRHGQDFMDNPKSGVSPMEVAIVTGQAWALSHAINKHQTSFNPRKKFSDGSTLMHFACLSGHTDCLDVLLNYGYVDLLNVKSADGRLPEDMIGKADEVLSGIIGNPEAVRARIHQYRLSHNQIAPPTAVKSSK